MKANYDIKISNEDGGYVFDIQGHSVAIYKYPGGKNPGACIMGLVAGRRSYVGRSQLSTEFVKIVEHLEQATEETSGPEDDQLLKQLEVHLYELAISCTQ